MRVTTTVSLFLVLSGLSSYYFFSGTPPAFFHEAPSAGDKVLSLGKGDSLVFLEIKNPQSEETISLKRKEQDWYLTWPVYYPAENFLVEGMALALTITPRERRFSLEGISDKEFGFDTAPIRVGVKTAQDAEMRTLVIGKESPTKSGVYARWEKEKEAFLLPAQVKASFERTVYSLRQKKLFRLSWDKVNWIYVKSGAKKFRIEKKDGKWFWKDPPIEQEVGPEKISDLIYALQSLYVKEFFDKEAHPRNPQFHLTSPAIFVAAGEKEGAEEKVAVGAPVPGKDGRYGTRASENLVLIISERNIKALLELFEVTFQEVGENDADSRPDSRNSKEASL